VVKVSASVTEVSGGRAAAKNLGCKDRYEVRGTGSYFSGFECDGGIVPNFSFFAF
jgi:hypothetical protein